MTVSMPDGAAATRSTVVICTLNRPDRLGAALAALGRCEPRPAEVIIVDGDPGRSAAPVVRRAAGEHGSVRYLATSPGLTHQRNCGLAAAHEEIVVFLDDDARPAPDVFALLPAVFTDSSVVGATGRVVEPSSHRFGHQTSRLRRLLFSRRREGTFTRAGYPRRLTDLSRPRSVEFMPGCFMGARTETARVVGFDEELGGYGLGEDEDFSVRLSRRGTIVFVPELVVEHDNAGFGGRDRRSFSALVVRNRAYLFVKNFPQTLAARAEFTALLGLLMVHRLANRDVHGALGIVDGTRELLRSRGRL
jgi:GT2 family glycosyltransferase